MTRLAALLFLLAGSLLSVLSPAVAQGVIDVPDASECTVDPVQLLDLLAMLNETEGLSPVTTIAAEQVAFEQARGEPLSEEDETGIEDTTRQLAACANAGDPFRMAALLSESFQARLVVSILDENGLEAVVEQIPLLSSETAENDGVAALPIDDAWYGPDTTKVILAVVEPRTTDPEDERQFLVRYVYSIDRWLVDNVWLIEEE